jgi:hypothetical protein
MTRSDRKKPARRAGDPVGYRRPPSEHRFRSGQSGNPEGRPRGAKSESTILREILGRKIETRIGGHVRKLTVLEGILLRIADDSLKGEIRSAAFLLNRFGQFVSGELEKTGLNEDDREILKAFAERVKRSQEG